MRSIVLLEHDFICVSCGNQATMVDHIVPTKIDWARRLDKSNLQPLCDACHNQKTKRRFEEILKKIKIGSPPKMKRASMKGSGERSRVFFSKNSLYLSFFSIGANLWRVPRSFCQIRTRIIQKKKLLKRASRSSIK